MTAILNVVGKLNDGIILSHWANIINGGNKDNKKKEKRKKKKDIE
jgi:hypothetical protein